MERGGESVWSGRLVLGTRFAVYLGPSGSAEPHRHDAIQIIWQSSAPVRLTFGDHELTAEAAMVPPRVEHGLDAGGAQIVMLLVEPTGATGRRLTMAARGLAGRDLSAQFRRHRLPTSDDPGAVAAWAQEVLAQLTGQSSTTANADVRPEIVEALAYCDRHLGERPSLDDVAREVGLSARQFRRSSTTSLACPSGAICCGSGSGAPRLSCSQETI